MKIPLPLAVELSDQLNRKMPAEALSGGRHRHRFDGFTVTLVGAFDFETITLTYMGTFFGFYNDMDLFRIRRGDRYHS